MGSGDTLLDAALRYARHGYPVFPLKPRSKVPATASGFKDATTDADRIAEWWTRMPDANIGSPTGVRFDVLDVDDKSGGWETFEALEGDMPPGPVSLTGGGGAHYLFAPSGIRNKAGALPGLDWRGLGGYVCLPPSVHESGRQYVWGPDPRTPLPDVPEWLRVIVDPPRVAMERPALKAGPSTGSTSYGTRALDEEIRSLVGAPDGTRNEALNKAAFSVYQLVAGEELDEMVAEAALIGAAGSIGLDVAEVRGTLRSAKTAAFLEPRSAPVQASNITSMLERLTVAGAVGAGAHQIATHPSRLTPLSTFLQGEDPEPDWVIPGLMERGDRLMLTGMEGQGKMTMLRQIGVAASLGVHPFTLEPISPITVFLLDLQDGPRQNRRRYRELTAGHGIPDRFYLEMRSSFSLLNDLDLDWLQTLLDEAQPDLFILGPLYRAVDADPIEEQPAVKAQAVLDYLIDRYDMAVAIEAHTKHQEAPYKPLPPYGASAWKRWPEFGYWMEPTPADDMTAPSRFLQWRGPREEREWPRRIRRAVEWPWASVPLDSEIVAQAVKAFAVSSEQRRFPN